MTDTPSKKHKGPNEWFFEDQAGQELVYLNAGRNRFTTIGNDDELYVHRDKYQKIDGDAKSEVVGNELRKVDGWYNLEPGHLKVLTGQHHTFAKEAVLAHYNDYYELLVQGQEKHYVRHWYNLETGNFKIQTGNHQTFSESAFHNVSGDVVQNFGSLTTNVAKGQKCVIRGDVFDTVIDNHKKVTFGTTEDQFFGKQTSLFQGRQTSVFSGGKYSFELSAGIAMALAAKININAGIAVTINQTLEMTMKPTAINRTNTSIKDSVNSIFKSGLVIFT